MALSSPPTKKQALEATRWLRGWVVVVGQDSDQLQNALRRIEEVSAFIHAQDNDVPKIPSGTSPAAKTKQAL